MTDQNVPPPYFKIESGDLAINLFADLVRTLQNKGLLEAGEVRAILDSAIQSGKSPAAQDVIRRDLSKLFSGLR